MAAALLERTALDDAAIADLTGLSAEAIRALRATPTEHWVTSTRRECCTPAYGLEPVGCGDEGTASFDLRVSANNGNSPAAWPFCSHI